MSEASIYVLAGVNGAGKSSIAGAAFRNAGADYYNPDEFARALRVRHANMDQREANAQAWSHGVSLLERALAQGLDFAFETTLGGNTIPSLLKRAASPALAIRVWYVGLASPELHLARVHARVRKGGHDIPEADVRRRYEHSRLNLIELLPSLTALRVFDNSTEADPDSGKTPVPRLVLQVERQRITGPRDLRDSPPWAKPIVAAAMRQFVS